MPNAPISGLPLASSISAVDLSPLEQGGVTKKTTFQILSTFINSQLPSVDTIYNSDGIIEGERIVNVDDKSLSFDGIGGSSVSINTETSFITSVTHNIQSSITNIASSDFSLTDSVFIGGGTKGLGVNNVGKVIPLPLVTDTNIYNTDGTLTGHRIVNILNNTLEFNGTAGSNLVIDTQGLIITSDATSIFSDTTNIASADINLTDSVFVGGGNQQIGVDNTGKIIPIVDSADINIYNTDGTLTSNRVLSLGGFDLNLGNISTSLIKITTAGNVEINSITEIKETSPLINLISPSVSMGDSPASISTILGNLKLDIQSGVGTRFLTVDSTGLVGNSLAPPVTNIYNADGTLTGNRTVTLGTNNLLFSGTGNFLISTNLVNLSASSWSFGFGLTNSGQYSFNTGFNNQCTGINSFLSGDTNTVSNDSSGILGGKNNNNDGKYTGLSGCTNSSIIRGGIGGSFIGGANQSKVYDYCNGILAGTNNVILGEYSGIVGGNVNSIDINSVYCAILGGSNNTISNMFRATIIGGNQNTISGAGIHSDVSIINCSNTSMNASPTGSCAIGTVNGIVSTLNSLLLGGSGCTIGGAGQYNNILGSATCSISNGINNLILGSSNSNITTDMRYCSIISSLSSTLSGTGLYSAIIGGESHQMLGSYSASIGGTTNYIGSSFSIAIGSLVDINHDNVISFNTGASGTFSSVNPNTIIMRASNGIGLQNNNPTSQVFIGGTSYGMKGVSTNTNTTTSTQNSPIILVDATAGARTVDLSTSTTVAHRFYTIVRTNTNGNNVTITTEGAQTIDGNATYVLNNTITAVTLYCDGTNWKSLSNSRP